MSAFTSHLLSSESRLPLVVEPTAARTELQEFLEHHGATLGELLLLHGALLLRGFRIDNAKDFDEFLRAVGSTRLDYIYRSTPRTAVGERIYTATEYPPARTIPFHNELAYQRDWPMKLVFCCLTPASTGGETPLADMRRVTAAVGENLCERFERRGVRYVRHYMPHIDLPWQTVFQTNDREELAVLCKAMDIEHEWLEPSTLRTSQVCQGMARHPVTGENVFFNQAALFHVSALGTEAAKSVIALMGMNRLPRHAQYGDGEEIAQEDLEHIRNAFAAQEIRFAWHRGDILFLDNMQAAHARRPFTGHRRVLAALMDAYSLMSLTESHPWGASSMVLPIRRAPRLL